VSNRANLRKSLNQMLTELHDAEVAANQAKIQKQKLHPRRIRNIEPVRFTSLSHA